MDPPRQVIGLETEDKGQQATPTDDSGRCFLFFRSNLPCFALGSQQGMRFFVRFAANFRGNALQLFLLPLALAGNLPMGGSEPLFLAAELAYLVSPRLERLHFLRLAATWALFPQSTRRQRLFRWQF